MHDYQPALSLAITVARETGGRLRDAFHAPGGPVAVDAEVEQQLRERLLQGIPGWAYLGEETGAGGTAGAEHCWVVDPHDATTHFLKGRRGSSVSIALLRDGEPVLGVVYAFGYPDDDGDLIAWAEGCGSLTRNGQPVPTPLSDADLADPDTRFHPGMIVYLTPDLDDRPVPTTRRVAPARYAALPSIAYRLALVAAGEGAATLSLTNPCSWDYAAGHALVRAAGGVLVQADGSPVTYGRDGAGAVAAVFGGGPMAVAALRQRDWLTEPTAEMLRPSPQDLARPWAAEHLLRPTRYRPVRNVAGRAVRQPALLARRRAVCSASWRATRWAAWSNSRA